MFRSLQGKVTQYGKIKVVRVPDIERVGSDVLIWINDDTCIPKIIKKTNIEDENK
jgi:hypothetical protein